MYLIICLRSGEAASEQREKNRMQSAHISRCWIKYCLNLLEDAKKLLEVPRMALDAIAHLSKNGNKFVCEFRTTLVSWILIVKMS